MEDPLSWTHPIVWISTIYIVLSLGTAAICFWLRKNILTPQKQQLSQDLNDIQMQLQKVQVELKQANRQADKGLEKLEDIFSLFQGLFLALIETRLIMLLMRKLRRKPFILRVGLKKGVEQVFSAIHGLVKTTKIDIDEAA